VPSDRLAEIRGLITTHARPDLWTSIVGMLLSKVEWAAPDHSLTEPLLVVLAQGAKRLMLGDQVHEYRAGQFLLVTATLPVSGHFIDAATRTPALGMGLVLRPDAIAPLLLLAPARRWSRGDADLPAIATGEASPDALDGVTRLLRLLDSPADAAVLAP